MAKKTLSRTGLILCRILGATRSSQHRSERVCVPDTVTGGQSITLAACRGFVRRIRGFSRGDQGTKLASHVDGSLPKYLLFRSEAV